MSDLTVSYIQSDLYWESVEANLAMFEEKIWQLEQPVDLIVLPEMFTTGFSMNPARLAEPMNSKTFRWMKQQAAQREAVIMGSYIVKDNQQFFNRLFAVKPDGTFYSYDKRHLFTLAGEHKSYVAGKIQLIFEWKGWRICPQICYDLRFPVFARSQRTEEHLYAYDLLIFVANWPAPRINAWDTLIQARAIENIAYCMGVNRTGSDPNGMEYPGHSAICSFTGEIIHKSSGTAEAISETLSMDDLIAFRDRFPFQKDSDLFDLK